jgi:death-on-curing protein
VPWVLIDAEGVIAVHDRVLNPGELAGLAGDRSLEGALARVENRIAYGLIGDVQDLAAAYAVALARGHVFNDGNKRTAFAVMELVLRLNGAGGSHDAMAAADWIVAVAAGARGEAELAGWLRAEAGGAGSCEPRPY